MNHIAIVGTTTWGTTIGLILARRSVAVRMLARTPEEGRNLQESRENERFLPGVKFPDSMHVTHDPVKVIQKAQMIIIAVPSNAFRENIKCIQRHIDGSPLMISASKGLEMDSGLRMSEILEDELTTTQNKRICVLSGPNLAAEIVRGVPASVVVASRNEQAAQEAQGILISPTFRVYTNSDVIGVELGGALKNIIALGAGICDGLGYGDNGKAAFITRGLAEITRLGVIAGANPTTFAGLAGLGDLIATCSSRLSRNHYVGEQLAKGIPLNDILDAMNNVAEGVHSTGAALKMADKLGIDMPITEITYSVLFNGLDPRQAVARLMERPPTAE